MSTRPLLLSTSCSQAHRVCMYWKHRPRNGRQDTLHDRLRRRGRDTFRRSMSSIWSTTHSYDKRTYRAGKRGAPRHHKNRRDIAAGSLCRGGRKGGCKKRTRLPKGPCTSCTSYRMGCRDVNWRHRTCRLRKSSHFWYPRGKKARRTQYTLLGFQPRRSRNCLGTLQCKHQAGNY